MINLVNLLSFVRGMLQKEINRGILTNDYHFIFVY